MKTDDRKKNDEKTSLTAARETRFFIMKRKVKREKTNFQAIRRPSYRLGEISYRKFTQTDALVDFRDFVTMAPFSILCINSNDIGPWTR